MKEAKLPQRDWILLPLISILTICLLVGSTEWIAKLAFPVSDDWSQCLGVQNFSIDDARGIPNSVCRIKLAESGVTEFHFNSCGHRADMECWTKPPGTYRIALTGTSLGMGVMAPEGKDIAALLPQELSQKTGRKVDLYNESLVAHQHNPSMITNDLLAAHPDLILWIVSPFDIKYRRVLAPDQYWLPLPPGVGDENPTPGSHMGLLGKALRIMKKVMAKGPMNEVRLLLISRNYRAVTAAEHFLYMSQALYVKSYLKSGDDESGYLRDELSATWQSRMRGFAGWDEEFEAQIRAAGVPVAVVLVPSRAQAAMISIGEWPKGYDPFKVDKEMRSIIVNHGGTYLDILPDFRTIPNPERYYFPADGHPNASGHAAFSALIAKELTSGAIPALRASGQSQSAREQGR